MGHPAPLVGSVCRATAPMASAATPPASPPARPATSAAVSGPAPPARAGLHAFAAGPVTTAGTARTPISTAPAAAAMACGVSRGRVSRPTPPSRTAVDDARIRGNRATPVPWVPPPAPPRDSPCAPRVVGTRTGAWPRPAATSAISSSSRPAPTDRVTTAFAHSTHHREPRMGLVPSWWTRSASATPASATTPESSLDAPCGCLTTKQVTGRACSLGQRNAPSSPPG
jgi:hypothetical protein